MAALMSRFAPPGKQRPPNAAEPNRARLGYSGRNHYGRLTMRLYISLGGLILLLIILWLLFGR